MAMVFSYPLRKGWNVSRRINSWSLRFGSVLTKVSKVEDRHQRLTYGSVTAIPHQYITHFRPITATRWAVVIPAYGVFPGSSKVLSKYSPLAKQLSTEEFYPFYERITNLFSTK